MKRGTIRSGFETKEQKRKAFSGAFKLGILLILLTGFSKTAFAQTADMPTGAGTITDPYRIATLNNLYWVTQNPDSWDATFKQTNNIDASSTSGWDGGAGFSPIGNYDNPFKGNYFGDGHTITSLFINRGGSDYIGMFGVVNDATIIKLGLISVSIDGDSGVGGLVGYTKPNYHPEISNCYVTGSISASTGVGGLVGLAGSIIIKNSYTTATVTADHQSYLHHIGGLVGSIQSGSVSNSYSTGSVNTNETNEEYYGGLIGSAWSGISITNSYWDVQTSGISTSNGGTSLTSSEMKQEASFSEWDFENTWDIDPSSNDGYPTLIFLPNEAPTATNVSVTGTLGYEGVLTATYDFSDNDSGDSDEGANYRWVRYSDGTGSDATTISDERSSTYTITLEDLGKFIRVAVIPFDGEAYGDTVWSEYKEIEALYAGGDGTEASPFEISSASELNNVRRVSDGYFKLISDIDLSSVSNWEPINDFNGNFDGNGYTISNLNINRGAENDIGLFGYGGGTLVRVALEDVSVTGAHKTGGLYGFLENGSVSESYTTGSINGRTNTGGFIGYIKNSTISNSYTLASINAGSSDTVGGLIGQNQGGSVANSYAAGLVSSTGSQVGGLIGYTSGEGSSSGSYWNEQVTGRTDSDGGTGESTLGMKFQTRYSGWDFNDIWGIESGVSVSYPYLRNAEPEEKPGKRVIFQDGDGTETNPYQIADSIGVYFIRYDLDAHYQLTSSIDLSTYSNWEPINNFSGEIDGAGYTISGLTIDRSSTENIGLFGYGSGTLSKIALVEVSVTGGSNTGALYGYMTGGSISESYSSGSVTGGENTGGLVGQLRGSISNSYSVANIDGGSSSNIGGLVGINYQGSITRSFASGEVTGSGTRVLGLVGYESGGSTNESYWDTETTGKTDSYGGTGKTTDEMKAQSTFTNWDFTNIWSIIDGARSSYPYLRNNEPDDKPGVESNFEGGTGTQSDPYLIATPSALNSMRDELDAYYKLTADINLGVSPYNEGNGWEPIGTNSAGQEFSGELNGNGYSIKNLFISRGTTNFVGLFGATKNAVVKNIAFEDVDITGQNYVGAAVGINYGTIRESYTTGSVNGDSHIGGIVGANEAWEGSPGEIRNTYSLVDVNSAGNNSGGIIGRFISGEVLNVYASGEVNGTNEIGGLVGVKEGGTLTSGYWNSDVFSSDNGIGTGKTTSELQDQDTFSGWDFSDPWNILSGATVSYPYLKDLSPAEKPGESIGFAGGSGTEGDPYQIANAATLNSIRDNNSAHYILVADIDLNVAPYNQGSGWLPISSFSGSLNGDGYVISNLFINRSSSSNIGFINSNNGTLTNIGLEAVNVYGASVTGTLVATNTGSISGSYVTGKVTGSSQMTGGMVGVNQGTIQGSYTSVTAYGESRFVGGLAGSMSSGSIQNSYANGKVSNSFDALLGGVVGARTDGNIISSFWNSDSTTIDNGYGTAKATAELQDQSTFSDWDFSTSWVIESSGTPTLQVFVRNEAPSAANVIVTGTVEVDEILTGSYTYSDIDGDAESGSAFKWYVASDTSGAKTEISGATATTYTLTNSENDKYIQFEVVPSDGNSSGNSVVSAWAGPVTSKEEPVFNTAVNKAISFNDGGYISLEERSGFNAASATDNFSLSLWIKTSGTNQALFGEFYATDYSTRNYLFINGEGKLSFDNYEPSGGTTSFDTSVNTGEWVHVVYVQESGTRKAYVNGVLESTTGASEAYTGTVSSRTYLGLRGGVPQEYKFSGLMDEVTYWDKALSTSEVSDAYNGSIDESDGNLLGYFSFDEESGTDIVATAGSVAKTGRMKEGMDEDDRVDGPELGKPFSATVLSNAISGTVISDSVIQVTENTPSFQITDADGGPFSLNSEGKFILTRDLASADTGSYQVSFKVTLEGDEYNGEAVINIQLHSSDSPSITSITRQSPSDETIKGINQVTLRVAFDKPVVNVDTADFEITGSVSAELESVSSVSDSLYDVVLSDIENTNGTLGITIKGTGSTGGTNNVVGIQSEIESTTSQLSADDWLNQAILGQSFQAETSNKLSSVTVYTKSGDHNFSGTATLTIYHDIYDQNSPTELTSQTVTIANTIGAQTFTINEKPQLTQGESYSFVLSGFSGSGYALEAYTSSGYAQGQVYFTGMNNTNHKSDFDLKFEVEERSIQETGSLLTTAPETSESYTVEFSNEPTIIAVYDDVGTKEFTMGSNSQSFTAVVSDTAYGYQLKLLEDFNTGTYTLYEGVGTSGTVLATGSVEHITDADSSEYTTIAVFDPEVYMIEGQSYTLHLYKTGPGRALARSSGNYSGGSYHSGTGSSNTAGDYIFRVITTPNFAPEANSVRILGNLSIGEMLNGSYTYSDTENEPESGSTYKWYSASDTTGTKTLIAGATDTSFTVTSSEEGKYLQFVVFPNDGNSAGDSVASAWVGPVTLNNPPSITSITRQDPFGETIKGVEEVTLRVAFDKPVANVDTSDFEITGSVSAELESVSSVSDSLYDVVLSNIENEAGTLSLAIKGTGNTSGSNNIVGIEKDLQTTASQLSADDWLGQDALGQSFQAETSNKLNSVTVYTKSGSHNFSGTATLTIYHGIYDQNSPTELTSQTVTIANTIGAQTFTINEKPQLTQGESYSFVLSDFSGSGYALEAYTSSGYAQGQVYFTGMNNTTHKSNFDLKFEVEEGSIQETGSLLTTAPGISESYTVEVNSLPVASNVSITGTLSAGDTLVVSYDFSDEDADSNHGAGFQWYRADDNSGTNQTAISGATDSTYIVSGNDTGKYLSVGIKAYDGIMYADSVLSGFVQIEALFANGSGTEEDPFQISTADELNNVRFALSSHFILIADIDLDEDPFNSGEGWEPIGTSTNEFTGNFNGGLHSITNLFIDRSETDYVGLFGHISSGGRVDSLKLRAVDITGKNRVGGIVGYNNGSITYSYSEGSVGGVEYVGGLVGLNQGSVAQSFTYGEVEGTKYVGGLTGYIHWDGAAVSRSYSLAEVHAIDNYVGGLSGDHNRTITNSYAAGSVTTESSSSTIGGLVGNSDGNINNSFWDGDVNNFANNKGGTKTSSALMRTESNFTNAGWDFDNTWTIQAGVNDGYPYLQGLTPPPVNNAPVASNASVSGQLVIDSVLTSNYDFSDLDGDSESGSTFKWFTVYDTTGSATEISGATASTYTLTSSENGKFIRFQVTPKDGSKKGLPVNSEWVGPVAEYNPPAIASIVRQLPSSEMLEDEEEAVFRVTFDMPVLNVDTTDFETIGSVAADIDTLVAVSDSVYDITVINIAEANGNLGISVKGTGSTGGINDITSFARNDFQTASQLSTDDWLGQEELGQSFKAGTSGKLKSVAIYTKSGNHTFNGTATLTIYSGTYDEGGTSELTSQTVNITDDIGAQTFVLTEKPALTQGETYSFVLSNFSGSGYALEAYTSSGYASGQVYFTGMNSSHKENMDLRFRVTEENFASTGNLLSTAPEVSEMYTVGHNAVPVASDISIEGVIKVDSTISLSYNYSDDDGDDNAGAKFQWYRSDDDSGTNESSIHNAEDSTYTISAADAGKYLRAAVIPFDGTAYGDTAWSGYQQMPEISTLFADGEGTEADPYQVTTPEELDHIRYGLDAHYELQNDIDLDVAPYNENEGWEPVGTLSDEFTGTLDGNSNTISGLYINRSSESYQGLFGVVNNAEITGLTLDEVDITGNGYTGALVGELNGINSEISYVRVSGEITGNSEYVGGLVGYQNEGSITNTVTSGTVEGGNYTSGLVGLQSNGSIDQTFTNTVVSGSGSDEGGLLAYSPGGTVTNSFWNTDSTATSEAGTGLTTVEINNQTNYTNAGWDFSSTWYISESGSPELIVLSGNTKPTVDDVSIAGTYNFGSELVASYNFSDVDGDEESGSVYSWYSASDTSGARTLISGATDTSLVLSASEVGKYVQFVITPKDGILSGDQGESDWVGPVKSTFSVLDIVRHEPVEELTGADSVSFRVSFNKKVSDIDTDDFALSGTAGTDGTVTVVTAVSDSLYDVKVTGLSNSNGTINLDIKGLDASGTNTILATGDEPLNDTMATIDESYTIDSIAPDFDSGSIVGKTYGLDQNMEVVVTLDDTVLVDTTAGVPSYSIAMGGKSRTAYFYSGSGTQELTFRYTTIDGDFDGNGISISNFQLNGGSIADSAGNAASMTGSFSGLAGVRVDTELPGLTISATDDLVSGAFTVTFTFTENVSDFEAEDITVVNGAKSNFDTTSASVYTVVITPENDGEVTVDVDADIAVDAGGNGNNATTQLSVTNDESAPEVPILNGIISDTGNAGDDWITSDQTLTFTGTAQPGDSLEVFIGGLSIGKTIVDGDGNWEFDHTGTTLTEGNYSVTVKAIDEAGNTSELSGSIDLEIDLTAPSVPVISAISEDTGDSDEDNLTNATNLSFFGTADSNSTIEVFIGESSIGTTTADSSGNWEFNYSGTTLVEGSYSITAKAGDIAGNVSEASSALDFEVDLTAPPVPSVGAVGNDTGESNSDFITSDQGLIIGGLAASSSPVEVFIDGVSIGTTTTNAQGTWLFDYNGTSLDEGEYVITAKTFDAAGNKSSASSEQTLIIDLTSPDAPVISGLVTGEGAVNPNEITTDSTLIFAGTAEMNSEVEVFINGSSVGTVDADGSGDWELDHTGTSVSEGSYSITAKAKDLAGNLSSASESFSLTVDYSAPEVPFISGIIDDTGNADDDGITTDQTLKFAGTAQANDSLEVFLDEVSIGKIKVGEDGNWQFDHTSMTLTEGTYTITVQAFDDAGNTSELSNAFEIKVDLSVPSTPVIAGFSDDNGESDDELTNDATLSFFGTADTSITVELFVNGSSIGTTETETDSTWSFDHTGTELGEGVFVITSQAVDEAGNRSGISDSLEIEVDLTAPSAPVIAGISEDTGYLDDDQLTNDTTLTFFGTADSSSEIEVFIDDSSIGTTTADNEGNWTFDHTGTTLDEGSYRVTAETGDDAGNISVVSSVLELEIDTTSPSTPAVLAVSDDTGDSDTDLITEDQTLIISGSADAGDSVDVYLDDETIGTVLADGTGTWTLDHAGTTLDGGSYTLSASVTDDAGNTSDTSEVKILTIDLNSAPVISSLKLTGNAHLGENLTAQYNYSDSNNDEESGTSFKWYISTDTTGTKTLISGESASVYSIATSDEGKFIQLVVSPNDGKVFGDSAVSAWVGPVVEYDPPVISSISRQEPSEETIRGKEQLTFRVSFSSPVFYVDSTDFEITGPEEVIFESISAVNDSTYDVTLNGVPNENGTISLAIKGAGSTSGNNNITGYNSVKQLTESQLESDDWLGQSELGQSFTASTSDHLNSVTIYTKDGEHSFEGTATLTIYRGTYDEAGVSELTSQMVSISNEIGAQTFVITERPELEQGETYSFVFSDFSGSGYNLEAYTGSGYAEGQVYFTGMNSSTHKDNFDLKFQISEEEITLGYALTGDAPLVAESYVIEQNSVPSLSNVQISGIQQVNESLAVRYNFSDPDNDNNAGSEFVWYRADDNAGSNESVINGADDSTYTVKGTDALKFLRAAAVPFDGTAYGDTTWSSYVEIEPLFDNGTGTEEDPYLISNAEELDMVRLSLSSHYRQTADIDLTQETGSASGSFWNSGSGWQPIGSQSDPFTGSYDGDGNTIDGLFIDRPNEQRLGLFGHGRYAEFKNMGLTNIDISAGSYLGGIVGFFENGTISESFATGTIKTNNSFGQNIGGLAGLGNQTYIRNSYANVNVDGYRYIGGIAGSMTSHSVVNSYAAGQVVGTNTGLGGLIGLGNPASESFWNSDSSSYNTNYGTGISTSAMQTESTFTDAGWNFSSIWYMSKNGYPELLKFAGNLPPMAEYASVSGKYQIDSTLTLSYDFSDINGDPEDGSVFQWFSATDTTTSADMIDGAQASTYKIISEDVGSYIRAVVVPGDGVLFGDTLHSKWMGPVTEPLSLGRGSSIALGDTTSGVKVDSLLAVKFNQELFEVDLSGVVITDESGSPVANVSASIDGNSLSIDHDDFGFDEIYTVTIPAGAISNAGGGTNEEMSWSFKTSAAAPMLVNQFPSDNASGMFAEAQVYAIFDKEILLSEDSGIEVVSNNNDTLNTSISVESSSVFGAHNAPVALKIHYYNAEPEGEYTAIIPAGAVQNTDSIVNDDSISISFTIRPGELSVQSIYPEDGSSKIALDEEVYAKFSHQLTEVDLSGISIKETNSGEILDGAQVEISDSSLVFSGQSFENATSYTVTIPANTVSNSANNNQAVSWSFTTIQSLPVISEVTPVSNAEHVPLDAAISAVFNMDVSEVDLSGITIKDEDDLEVASVVASLENDRTITITHDDLEYNTSYTVHIPSGAVSNSDDLGNEAMNWSFSTLMSVPEVVALSPEDGSTGIATDSVISVSFDQKLTEIDFSGITIMDAKEESVSGIAVTLEDSLLSISHADLSTGMKYTVTIPDSAVINASGIGNEMISWSFTTIQSLPVISEVTPVSNAEHIPLDAAISAVFNMDVSEVDLSGITIKDEEDKEVTDVVASLTDNTIITITHDDLEFNTSYTVHIPSGAVTNSDGLANEAMNWSFSTLMSVPEIVALSPEDGSTGIANDSTISVSFNQMLAEVDLSGITITGPNETLLSGVSATLVDSILTIAHSEFSEGELYTIVIPDSAVVNASGVGNAAVTWSFRTILSKPVVVARSPQADTSSVSLDAPVVVTFDQKVEVTDLSQISITDETDTEVAGVSPVLTDSRIVITHDGFTNNTLYIVQIPEGVVQNSDSVVNESIEWQFRTIMKAPEFLAFSPEDGAKNVSIDAPVTVKADQEILVGNIAGITIQDASGNNVGNLDVTVADSLITISHEGLDNFTTYTVSIAEGSVMNEDSVENEPEEWSFTTIINLPEQIVLSGPEDQAGSVELELTYSWVEDTRSETYDFQLSTDSSFSTILIDNTQLTDVTLESESELEYYQQYFWRVRGVNVAGVGEWSDVSKFVTKAEIPVQVFPLDKATEISTAPRMQWDSNHEGVSVQLQLATTSTFESLITDSLVSEGFEAIVNGLSANTTYFWRVRIVEPATTSEWSFTQNFTTRPDPEETEDEPIVVNITFGGTSGGSSSGGNGDPGNGGEEPVPASGKAEVTDYRLVGLPGTDNIRLDDFFTGKYMDEWRAFVETGRPTDFYDEYSPDDQRFVFKPGMGFWVLSTKIVADEYNFTPVQTNDDDAFGVAVHEGWNIIANPYRTNVEWKLVQELNGITSSLFGYEKQFVEKDTMKVLEGYYFYNDPSVNMDTLYIPYTGFDQRGIEEDTTDAAKGLSKLIVEASLGGKLEASVELVYSDSLHKHQSLLTSYHPDLDMAGYGMVMSDEQEELLKKKRGVYNYNPEGELYELKVKAKVGSKIHWNTSFENQPEDAMILLVNKITNEAVLFAAGEKLETLVSEPTSRFDMYVGDHSYLKAIRESLVPDQIELRPNYPNPFNPTTTINYALTKRVDVRLEVYDVLGRLVQTLVSGPQEAGWHKVRFDGRGLSSGVYFYRLHAGKELKLGKMTLIK